MIRACRFHYQSQLQYVHGELSLLGKVNATIPSVTESVWPFPGDGSPFVPNVLFCPDPSSLSHFENEFYHVGMTLPLNHVLFDVEDKGPQRRLKMPRLRPLKMTQPFCTP